MGTIVFFPLMKTPSLDGFCDLVYEGPNNWENRIRKPVYVYLLWSNGKYWCSKRITEMRVGDYARVTTADVDEECLATGLALIYPSLNHLETQLNSLPSKKVWYSEIPAWRNTAGFSNKFTQVSYQADIEPLPPKASLLTFHPFIQFGDVINNLLVLNVTSDPKIQSGKISMFNSHDKSFVAEAEIYTNSLTTIPLDLYNFKPTDLPVFYSPSIAGIPFGLGISKSGKMLSLEHTHPPASLVLHGDRSTIQGKIKKSWIEKLVKA
jgi:hypothetical protein